MSPVSRKERKRLGRLDRHKEVAVRRHEAASYLATFRKLIEARWLPKPEDLPDDADPALLRLAIESVCAAVGVVPGDSGSWEMLVKLLLEEKVPAEVCDAVIDKWAKHHPEDPDPFCYRFALWMGAGAPQRAAQVVAAAARTPAGALLMETCERHLRQAGLDPKKILDEVEAKVAAARPAAG